MIVGGLFLVHPDEMAAIVELSLDTPLARGDIRTVYGGLEIGIAALTLAWCARAATIRAATVLHLATWGGLAGGRAVSLALSADPAASGTGLFGLELIGVTLGVVALLALRAPRSAG